MSRRFRIAILGIWPGLPQIVTGQEVLGLILSIGFAVALNLAIVSRWLWTEAFPAGADRLFAAAAAGTWLAGLAYTVWWAWRCHPDRYREEIDRLYREATTAYLQGRWNDARRRLERILTLDETDADALMQLGTLYLRVGQNDSARRAFRQCLEQQSGAKWRWEIDQAMGRLGGD